MVSNASALLNTWSGGRLVHNFVDQNLYMAVDEERGLSFEGHFTIQGLLQK